MPQQFPPPAGIGADLLSQTPPFQGRYTSAFDFLAQFPLALPSSSLVHENVKCHLKFGLKKISF